MLICLILTLALILFCTVNQCSATQAFIPYPTVVSRGMSPHVQNYFAEQLFMVE